MAEVSTALAAAWTRWQRYHELHRGRVELGVAEVEAQFELVATGLALDDKQVQALFQDDAQPFISLLTPLPNVENEHEDIRRFHFTLVAARALLDQYLQSMLQLERYVSLHHATLGMIQTLLQLAVKSESGQGTLINLFGRVKELLFEKREARDEESTAVSYGSLCSLLELLLCQKTEELVEASMEICEYATKNWKHHLQFLHMVGDAWESLETSSSNSTFPHELLYLVCIIIPKAPCDLIANMRVQKLVCFALRHNDALLRKQGLHILKAAFLNCCALLSVPQETETKGKTDSKPEVMWVDMWQNFLTASEVIQMHHEQHLIEQLTFDWMQSLLVRLFAHDNPVVKRLFISNFMETCIQAWGIWEKQRSTNIGEADEMKSEDHEKEDTMELVISAVFVLTQMSTHKMNSTADRTVFDLALAAKCLSIVGDNAAAVDSLRAFESERMDPSALIQMVNVLSLTLSQLAGSLANGSNGIGKLNTLLEEVWTAYSDSKAKPDSLTRAVVICMFQPVFLLRGELITTMKNWIAEFICFGSRHRPNVIFHLACRLCQTWRAHPASALIFVDELVELLLYKEPLIDEKEQLATDASAPFQGFQGFSPVSSQTTAIMTHAKDRFVRLMVLSFLDDIAVDSSASAPATQQLMNALLARLLALNVTPDWQKQHMLNSDGFGKKLRSWQALCIVSPYVTKSQLTELLLTLQTAFAVPQLPSVRYYIELF
ncbi:SpoU rRNA Methylase family, partial [Phytophthora palmivora]